MEVHVLGDSWPRIPLQAAPGLPTDDPMLRSEGLRTKGPHWVQQGLWGVFEVVPWNRQLTSAVNEV